MGVREVLRNLVHRRPRPMEWREWVRNSPNAPVERRIIGNNRATLHALFRSSLYYDLRMEESSKGVLKVSTKRHRDKRFRQADALSPDWPIVFAHIKEAVGDALGQRKKVKFLDSEISGIIFKVSKPNRRTIVVETPAVLAPDPGEVITNHDEQ